MSLVERNDLEFGRLLESFRSIDDPAERLMMLIEFASCYVEPSPAVAPRPFPAERRLSQCQGDIYFWALRRPDGRLGFSFAVESDEGISTRAFAVILQRSLSGGDPAEIVRIGPDALETIFGDELPAAKRTTLLAMLDAVHSSALEMLAED